MRHPNRRPQRGRLERTGSRIALSVAFVASALALSACASSRAPIPAALPTHSVITVVGAPTDVDQFVGVVDARRQLPTFARILEPIDPAPVFIVGSGAMIHQYLPSDRRLESEAFPGDLFLAPGVQYVDLEDLEAFPQWIDLGVTVPEWAVTHDTILAHVLAETSHGASTRADFSVSHLVGIDAENELRRTQGQEGTILFRQITMDGSRSGQPVLETGILSDDGGIWVERVHSDQDGDIRSIEYFEGGLLISTRWIEPNPQGLTQHRNP